MQINEVNWMVVRGKHSLCGKHDKNELFSKEQSDKHLRAYMSGSHHPIGSYRKLETFHLPSLQIYSTLGFENCSTTNFSKARI